MFTTAPGAPRSQSPSVTRRPGWPEIIVGVLALLASGAAVAISGPALADSDPVVYGLFLTAASGVIGFIAFGAAALVRIRSWNAFGVRKTTWRWILIAVAAGVVALLVKGVVNALVVMAVGPVENVQVPYVDAAGGGVLPLVLTLLFLSILTPMGEEFFFRGVIMSALLRYGPIIAVVASTVVFALFHGINLALPSALVVGLVAAEVFRRSGSIWTAVIVHVVNNLALPLFVAVTGFAG